MLMQTARASG